MMTSLNFAFCILNFDFPCGIIDYYVQIVNEVLGDPDRTCGNFIFPPSFMTRAQGSGKIQVMDTVQAIADELLPEAPYL